MNPEVSARARRVYDHVNELVSLALNMQGAAARMVESADEDDQFLVQVSSAHLLTYLRGADDRLRMKIFQEVAAIGALLQDSEQRMEGLSAMIEGFDEPTTGLRRIVREELARYVEGAHFSVSRRFDENLVVDAWGLHRIPEPEEHDGDA